MLGAVDKLLFPCHKVKRFIKLIHLGDGALAPYLEGLTSLLQVAYGRGIPAWEL
jgi:hypothetical protein